MLWFNMIVIERASLNHANEYRELLLYQEEAALAFSVWEVIRFQKDLYRKQIAFAGSEKEAKGMFDEEVASLCEAGFARCEPKQ